MRHAFVSSKLAGVFGEWRNSPAGITVANDKSRFSRVLNTPIMQLFQNIVVAVDLDLQTDRPQHVSTLAVEQATRFAESFDATLTLFSVLDCPDPDAESVCDDGSESFETSDAFDTDDFAALKSIAETARRRLQNIEAELLERGIRAKSKLAFGNPAEEIVRHAEATTADLIVISSRNDCPSQNSRAGLGVTSERVARSAHCPVWCAARMDRNSIDPPDGTSGEVLDVLFATDLQEAARESLDMLIAAAQMLDLRITLLHAVESPWWMARSAEADETSRSQAEVELHEQLAMTDFRTLPFGLLPRIEVGRAYDVIGRVVQELSPDVLVIASDRSADGGIVGETTDRILRTIGCSILILSGSSRL